MALWALAALGWSRSEKWGGGGKIWVGGRSKGWEKNSEGYNNPFTEGLDSN